MINQSQIIKYCLTGKKLYNKNEKQLRFFLLRLKHLMPQTFSSERFLENKIRIIIPITFLA